MAATSSVDIHPSGDVVLRCGGGAPGPRCVKLRVSSVVMSIGSPVFKTMLEPRFREGSELNTTGMVEIPLPYDDPDHMTHLCNVLHLRHDMLPGYLDPFGILHFAKLCDKYACSTAVKPCAEGWTREALQRSATMSDEQRSHLLTAAHLFRNYSLRRQAGMDIVLNSSTSVSTITSVDSIVPKEIIDALQKTQTNARNIMHRDIENGVLGYLDIQSPNSSCLAKAAIVSSLLQQLNSCLLWPTYRFHDHSLAETLKQMESFVAGDFTKVSPCSSKRCEAHTVVSLAPMSAILRHAADRTRKEVERFMLPRFI